MVIAAQPDHRLAQAQRLQGFTKRARWVRRNGFKHLHQVEPAEQFRLFCITGGQVQH